MTTIQQYTPALDTNDEYDEKKYSDELKAEGGANTKVTVAEVDDGAIIETEQYTDEEYKRVKRKVDWVLLPLLWICYGIQQTDKTSIGTQALYGLREDTGLKGQQYAWLTTIFYLSYMVFEFPSTYMLQRWKMGLGLSLYMIAWGGFVLGVASAHNFTQLAVFRFFQGLFESTISPGFLFIIGSWYRTEEHASRSLFFQSANAGFGAIADLIMLAIARAAEKNPDGPHAWRGIGWFLGGMTLLAAGACCIMLGTPTEVWWLSKRDKAIANARILDNNNGTDLTGKKEFKRYQVIDALKDPQTWFCAANTFLSCIPNGGITTFGSLINKSFGFTNTEVILYGLPRNFVSVAFFAVIGITTRRYKGIRFYWMFFGCVPPFVGLLTIALLPADISYRWIKWGCYLMAVVFIIPTFMGWQMIPSNVGGKTKRTVVSSINFICYCVGNIIGSQVFRADDAPRYLRGTAVVAACIGVQLVVCIFWRFYYVWSNKKRDEAQAAMNLSEDEARLKGEQMGADDKTDRENPFFRYSL